MGKVTGILTGMAMPLIIFAILCLKFYGSIKKHMHLWGAIGRELDDKMVVPLTSYPHKNAHNNDYDSVGAPAREGGGNHRWDNSKDSLRLEGQVSLPSGESRTPHPPAGLAQGAQRAGQGLRHHFCKEAEGKELESPTTGYSRVALNSSTPGYVPWTATELKTP